MSNDNIFDEVFLGMKRNAKINHTRSKSKEYSRTIYKMKFIIKVVLYLSFPQIISFYFCSYFIYFIFFQENVIFYYDKEPHKFNNKI